MSSKPTEQDALVRGAKSWGVDIFQCGTSIGSYDKAGLVPIAPWNATEPAGGGFFSRALLAPEGPCPGYN
jgi:hypothetical protein